MGALGNQQQTTASCISTKLNFLRQIYLHKLKSVSSQRFPLLSKKLFTHVDDWYLWAVWNNSDSFKRQSCFSRFGGAANFWLIVLEGGAGKEILQPLSVVVLGGLFTSTALTLLVLPALYAQFGKFLRPQKPQTAVADAKVVNVWYFIIIVSKESNKWNRSSQF